MDGTPVERRGGPPAGIRRLRPDEPSKAITGGALNEFIHPFEDRPLTVRECARLQTFPDSFQFIGSTRDSVQLIGNAVPPHLAQIVAGNLLTDLSKAIPSQDHGALLTFVPTLSSGTSPVLKEVNGKVIRMFSPTGVANQLEMRWA